VSKAKVVPDSVRHIAGQDVGLERVDVHADAHWAYRADPPHIRYSCLPWLVATPPGHRENERFHKMTVARILNDV
jgi:hypothetical protein